MLKIGISIGDINGIGPEIILKTFSNKLIFKHFIPIIYGSLQAMAYHKKVTGFDHLELKSIKHSGRAEAGRINTINCWNETVKIELGKVTKQGGMAAHKALDRASSDLSSNNIDALVTAPIHKNAMNMAGFGFPGHTEYLEQKLGGKSLMLLLNDNLRVGVVTGHMALSEVINGIKKNLVIEKLKLLHTSLKIDFGISKPLIAVLGLNPHAGDGGVLGMEEIEEIRPAIIEFKKEGHLVYGPFAADGFFGSGAYAKYDAILAMYHDQGLVPFKTLSFGQGVNFTAGIGGVRTSPDHGVGYDIVGKMVADESSFRKAIFKAIDIVKAQKTYNEMNANPLKKLSREIQGQPDEVLEESA